MKMLDVEWAAGLFEGKGTVSKLSDRRHTHRLSVKLNDDEPLKRFMAAVETGKIYGPYPATDPYYVWIADGNDAIDVALMLKPRLSRPARDRLAPLVGSGA